jgi:hypothetical protein
VEGLLRDAVALLLAPGKVVEVRALTDQHTHSGYFSGPEALIRAVEPLDTDTSVLGIYVTLNEMNPALLSRRANRIKMRLSRKDATTGDADILHRRWLPIDIDPKRPSGVSSTDEEHGLALAKADEIAAWLTSFGFPEPITGDSGNGAHLLYRIDLANDEPATLIVKGCLAALDALFSDDRVSVDTANFNASRIWKLYGTISRKGDDTLDRPHRRSRIIAAPDVPVVVTVDQLRDLAARLPDEQHAQQQPVAAPGKGFDLRHWLDKNGIGIRSEKPYSGGTLFVLDQCPFSSAHKDGAFAIQFANGAVFAGCKHTSCGGGTQRWQELRERYEPGRAGKQKCYEEIQRKWKKDRAVAKAQRNSTSGPDPAPEATSARLPGPPPPPDPPPPGSSDFQKRAREVLTHGDPVAFMLAAFAQEHVGDEILARCMILSMASQAVKNSDGLHVSVTGDSGKGKTHAFRKMMRQVPAAYKVKGTVSNKALYYMKDLRPRTILMSDDTELSDSIQEILKSATSNFHEPITHTTVTKDLASRVCTIPERCVWWIAKKEGTGDDQVANRMLTCWIDESPEQDARVLLSKQKKECLEPDTLADETEELLTCRAIWEHLHDQTLWVVIPFSKRIRFNAITNRRNPDMLYDLIKSHAALFFMQRRQKVARDGTPCIYADETDFAAANEVFTLLNGTAGGQESKMTRREADILAAIREADQLEYSIQDLQRLTGSSYSGIYKSLKGYESRGKNYTGLLEKCPALSFTDRTITTLGEDGNTVRRRTEAYAWDRELYRQWNGGGACWLDPGPDGGEDDGSSGSDPGSFAASLHVSCTFAANAANKNDAPGAPGSCNGVCTDNNSVLRKGGLLQSGNYRAAHKPDLKREQSLHFAANAANNDRKPQDFTGSPKKRNTEPGSLAADAANVQQSAEKKHPLRSIRAKDYKKLDIPEPATACFVCGKKGAWFVEKFTKERRDRPKDQQDARRLCRSCYAAAVKAEQDAAVPLPGTVDISGMKRVMADLGKCPVCGVAKVEWIDEEAGVMLCGRCYAREKADLRDAGKMR